MIENKLEPRKKKNIDQAEIDKFSELAERWWNPSSEFKPLHDINPLRLNWILNTSHGLKNMKVLDVGCGGGILSESISEKGGVVTGIDMSEKAIEVAKLHKKKISSSVDYLYSASEDLMKEFTGSFDIVTCMEMLEHVPDPAVEIKNCATLLKPGGIVFFSTINRNLKSFLFAIIGAEYVLKLLPKGTHEYGKFLKPSEIEHFATPNKLVLTDIIGMTYNPFTKVYKLSKDTSVNYIMAFKKN